MSTSDGFTVEVEMYVPSVSVVVLNYNGLEILGNAILYECLRSVLATDYPSFEVLFVDNASTDSSVDFVKTEFSKDPRLRIVCNEKNLGFTEGNNRGIRKAKGSYIVLINTDTKVEPTWLKMLVKSATAPDVGAVQSKLLQMDNPEFLDCAGGFVDYYGYHLERGHGESSAKYKLSDEIFYAKGASVLLKREALAKSGLFDPAIFLYFDEVDLCWRLWLSGFKVVFAPDSLVYHVSGSTASSIQQPKQLYFYIRNHLMVLLKNYNLKNAFVAVTVSLFFEIRNLILFLIRRKSLVSISIMKALLWNLRHLKYVWEQRQIVQQLVRKVPDKEIRKTMLKPYPAFPLYVLFSRFRYSKK